MEIIINGKKQETADGISLIAVINEHRVNLNNCIVEINGKFIEKDDFSYTQLREGDKLELIRFIGGG